MSSNFTWKVYSQEVHNLNKISKNPLPHTSALSYLMSGYATSPPASNHHPKSNKRVVSDLKLLVKLNSLPLALKASGMPEMAELVKRQMKLGMRDLAVSYLAIWEEEYEGVRTEGSMEDEESELMSTSRFRGLFLVFAQVEECLGSLCMEESSRIKR